MLINKHNIISKIEEEKKKVEDRGESLSIDSAYIVQLIDKIFNT
jgi:hypothetical protein